MEPEFASLCCRCVRNPCRSSCRRNLRQCCLPHIGRPLFAGPYSLTRIRWRRFGEAVVCFHIQRVFASAELMTPVEAGPPDGRPWKKLWRSGYFLTFRSAHAFVNWSLDHIFAYSAL